jgi:hypothetical protein
MSWRTVIEINHDHLGDLDDAEIMKTLRRYLQSNVDAQRVPYLGHIRVLGTRHHSETLKLTVE